jgi:hypothetical protein
MGSIEEPKYKFEVVKGFFAQSEPETDTQKYDYVRDDQSRGL